MSKKRIQAILLPGAVLPAELAYPATVEALGPGVDARFKELEIYADDEPPEGNVFQHEVEGIRAFADDAGFDRFHLVGYSAGGASALAFCAAHPERLLSLSLNEPAWIGTSNQSKAEKQYFREFDRLHGLPMEKMMSEFIRLNLAPGVTPPPPPEGPPPPWMAKRPHGLRAINETILTTDLDHDALRRFKRPVLFTLGGRSSPHNQAMADRLADVFPDFTVKTFPGRHHFDPPHRAEPEAFAGMLRAFWEGAEKGRMG